jgi:hypothetical protein
MCTHQSYSALLVVQLRDAPFSSLIHVPLSFCTVLCLHDLHLHTGQPSTPARLRAVITHVSGWLGGTPISPLVPELECILPVLASTA